MTYLGFFFVCPRRIEKTWEHLAAHISRANAYHHVKQLPILQILYAIIMGFGRHRAVIVLFHIYICRESSPYKAGFWILLSIIAQLARSMRKIKMASGSPRWCKTITQEAAQDGLLDASQHETEVHDLIHARLMDCLSFPTSAASYKTFIEAQEDVGITQVSVGLLVDISQSKGHQVV